MFLDHFYFLDLQHSSRTNAEQFRSSNLRESDNDKVQTSQYNSYSYMRVIVHVYISDSAEIHPLKKVNVLENIQISTATTASSQVDISFEERVLKELTDLKKTQERFEERIESRIEHFFNDQTRMQSNSQLHLQGKNNFRFQGTSQSDSLGSQSHFQRNEHPRSRLIHHQSYEPGKYQQSGMNYPNRQCDGIRNGTQTRHREPVSPERYTDDFEDFEELDKNFPINTKANVEDLELSIRRDLDFKFLLVM